MCGRRPPRHAHARAEGLPPSWRMRNPVIDALPAPPPRPNLDPPISSRVTASPAMQSAPGICHSVVGFCAPQAQNPSKMGKRGLQRGTCQRNAVHQRASEALPLPLGHDSFSLYLNGKNVDHDSPRGHWGSVLSASFSYFCSSTFSPFVALLIHGKVQELSSAAF